MKSTITALVLLALLAGCARAPDPNTIVMVIESSPANLDPRVGTDGPSERIYELIFDALLRRDDHFVVQPGLAERWENPDPLTYVFHLRTGVKFHDGRPLTSADVKWTFDSVLNGSVRTPKTGTYESIAISTENSSVAGPSALSDKSRTRKWCWSETRSIGI